MTASEIRRSGQVVDYDLKDVGETEGVLTVNLSGDDRSKAEAFARANINGLALTADGERHACNVKSGATVVRRES